MLIFNQNIAFASAVQPHGQEPTPTPIHLFRSREGEQAFVKGRYSDEFPSYSICALGNFTGKLAFYHMPV